DQVGRIILQDLEMLALAQEVEKLAPEAEDGEEERISTGEGEINPEAVTVTLAVTPVEGEVLTVAESCADNFSGRLALALRPFGEHLTVEARSTWSATAGPPVCSQLLGLGLKDLKGSDEGSPIPREP
ncbi:unnamed protein product, partial [marine sediment metagenome]